MGLIKLAGLPQAVVVGKDYRENADRPEVTVSSSCRLTTKYYAMRLLPLTALTDPATVDKIRQAAEAIETPNEEDWTQSDAEKILSAVGAPPSPSHVLIKRVPGHSMWLFRAASSETKKAKRIHYRTGTTRGDFSVLRELRAEGIEVPEGTCLTIGVKLVEAEDGLWLAAFLTRGRQRSVSEQEKLKGAN